MNDGTGKGEKDTLWKYKVVHTVKPLYCGHIGPRKCVLIRTSETLLIREVSLIQRHPLREVPLYIYAT